MARAWNSWATKPFNVYGQEHIRLSRDNAAKIIESVLTTPYEQIEELARDKENPGLVYIAARSLIGASQRKEFHTVDKMLDRILGKSNQILQVFDGGETETARVFTFKEFCANAGYPEPFEAQIEAMHFCIFEKGARLYLGARGYGKTDYCVVLGMAYAVYLDYVQAAIDTRAPEESFLLVTKSDMRNASIIDEVGKACAANGVSFERQNRKELRVKGLHGKDPSIAALTIGSTSFRGRHPRHVIGDDLVTPEDTSEATRAKAERCYEELVKLSPNIAVIGQPVHKFDLYENLRPMLRKLEHPHGTIPELDHDLEAMAAAGVSLESISASYKLIVISESENPLENVKSIADFPVAESAAAFIDPSHEGGDYTALTIFRQYFSGVAVKGRVFKKAWFNCVDEIAEELYKCNVTRLCFETNALGEQPVVLLRDVLDGIGVVGRKSTNHKHSRIMAAGPFAPLIHMAETSDRLYKLHVRKYEHGAKYDDAPDSLATGLEWLGLIKGKV